MWPALIGAGASILGGLINSNSQENANAANLAFAERNLQFQQDQAIRGLRYRAEDATEAQKLTGINRMALLGAPTFSPSPVSAGQVGDTSFGSGVASAGQDLSRAAEAMSGANVRKTELENKLLEAQIANVNSDTVAKQASASSLAKKTAGATPPMKLYQTFVDPEGNSVILPSDKASTSLQNVASFPSNLAIGADMLSRNLGVRHFWRDTEAWLRKGMTPIRGDVFRNSGAYYYTPF